MTAGVVRRVSPLVSGELGCVWMEVGQPGDVENLPPFFTVRNSHLPPPPRALCSLVWCPLPTAVMRLPP